MEGFMNNMNSRSAPGEYSRLALLLIGLALLLPLAAFAPSDYINIWLFVGTPQESPPLKKQVEIMTIDSRPELSSLKAQVMGSEAEIKKSALRVLAEMHQLRMIEDTFFIQQKVNKGVRSLDEVALAKDFVYRLRLSTRTQPNRQVAVHAVITRSKEGVFKAESTGQAELRRAYSTSGQKKLMDILIEQDVVLKPDYPIIVATSSEKGIYYAMLLLRNSTRIKSSPEVQSAEKRGGREVVAVPEPAISLQPYYPRELKRRLIGGEIELQISVDQKGNVLGVTVRKPLHPYLDYCAVQAFLKWTFEPVLRKGRPIRASFLYSYYFDPRSSGEPAAEPNIMLSDASPTSAGSLGDILAHTRVYCRLLSEVAFNFVCEETIRETHYNLTDNISWAMLVLKKDSQLMIARPVQIIDPKRTIRNEFLCDYQLTRKGSVIEERRIVLRKNGQIQSDRKQVFQEKRFSGLSSLLSPLHLLSADRQRLFEFTFLENQRIQGRNAFVIDATPISGNEDGIWAARIWIDQQNYGILRCDIEGVPIDGYEDVLSDCAALNIKPSFNISHEFRFEKKGIFFPSRSRIRVSYPAIDIRGPIEKISIDLRYDNYKFFVVETETRVIK